MKALLLCVLCGCTQLFGLSDPHEQPRDAPRDAARTCIGDDFDDNMLAAMWQTISANHRVEEVAQSLQIWLDAGIEGYTGVMLTNLDITGTTIEIEVPRALALPGGQSFLSLDIVDDGLIFDASGTQLRATLIDAGQSIPVFTTDYDATLHRFWRIEATTGTPRTLIIATSSDGIKWNEHARDLVMFPFAGVTVAIGAGQSTAAMNPGPAIFDNFAIRDGTCVW